MNDHGHALEERAGAVFEPDTLLPSQYFDRIRRNRELDPERRLMFAVLEDAVTVCLKNAGATDPAHLTLLTEAEEWIADPDASWLYSFENICAVLDLHPDYIRRGLRAWKERVSRGEPVGRGAARAGGSDPEDVDDEPLRRASGD